MASRPKEEQAARGRPRGKVKTRPIACRVPDSWIEAIGRTAFEGEKPDMAKFLRAALRKELLDRGLITPQEAAQ